MKNTKKVLILKDKDSIEDLRKKIKKTNDEKYKTRLKAILLLKKKKKRKEVAEILVAGERTVTAWVGAYNKDGTEGLKTKPTGRPKGKTRWENEIFEKLTKEIDKSDRYWSVRLMREWIKKEGKEDVPESTVWYRVTQIGYSNKSSRPYPYKGDKTKQEAFKKGASPRRFRVLSSKA